MTFQSKALNKIFRLNHSEDFTPLKNLFSKSDETLTNSDFNVFMKRVNECIERENEDIKLLKFLFVADISRHYTKSQCNHICSLIIKHTTYSKNIDEEFAKSIQEMVNLLETNQASVQFYKFVSSQWQEGLGLPVSKLNKSLLCCQPITSFYENLSVFKRREYSSYAAQLSQTLKNYLMDIFYFRVFLERQNRINLQPTGNFFTSLNEKIFLRPYQIICVDEICDLDDYYAQVKFEGERLLVCRSKCAPNMFKCKIASNEGDPCNWIYFDKNMKLYSIKKYEECPIAGTLDYIFFPSICAAYCYESKHFYEKQIEKQLTNDANNLERLIKFRNTEGNLSHFVYNLKIEYNMEMQALEKKLVDEYLKYMLPVVTGHEQKEGELLTHQGYCEGVYGILPTFNCKRRRVPAPFANNNNEVLCNYMCTEPCIVLDCTMGYVSSLVYETTTDSQREDMMRQIKPYISRVKESEHVAHNVMIVHDIYSIGNENMICLPFEERKKCLKHLLYDQSDRVSKTRTRNLSKWECPKDALRQFMKNSLMYASSGLILRHKTNPDLVYSLKTKCCVDLICLALSINNFDVDAVYLGIKVRATDRSWLDSLSDNRRFDFAILCELSIRNNNLPDDLADIVYLMYEQQKTLGKPRNEDIVFPSFFGHPNEYINSEHRIILEIEGSLIVNNNRLLLNSPSGMIIDNALFKRVRYDRNVDNANTLYDLHSIHKNIMFMNEPRKKNNCSCSSHQ